MATSSSDVEDVLAALHQLLDAGSPPRPSAALGDYVLTPRGDGDDGDRVGGAPVDQPPQSTGQGHLVTMHAPVVEAEEVWARLPPAAAAAATSAASPAAAAPATAAALHGDLGSLLLPTVYPELEVALQQHLVPRLPPRRQLRPAAAASNHHAARAPDAADPAALLAMAVEGGSSASWHAHGAPAHAHDDAGSSGGGAHSRSSTASGGRFRRTRSRSLASEPARLHARLLSLPRGCGEADNATVAARSDVLGGRRRAAATPATAAAPSAAAAPGGPLSVRGRPPHATAAAAAPPQPPARGPFHLFKSRAPTPPPAPAHVSLRALGLRPRAAAAAVPAPAAAHPRGDVRHQPLLPPPFLVPSGAGAAVAAAPPAARAAAPPLPPAVGRLRDAISRGSQTAVSVALQTDDEEGAAGLGTAATAAAAALVVADATQPCPTLRPLPSHSPAAVAFDASLTRPHAVAVAPSSVPANDSALGPGGGTRSLIDRLVRRTSLAVGGGVHPPPSQQQQQQQQHASAHRFGSGGDSAPTTTACQLPMAAAPASGSASLTMMTVQQALRALRVPAPASAAAAPMTPAQLASGLAWASSHDSVLQRLLEGQRHSASRLGRSPAAAAAVDRLTRAAAALLAAHAACAASKRVTLVAVAVLAASSWSEQRQKLEGLMQQLTAARAQLQSAQAGDEYRAALLGDLVSRLAQKLAFACLRAAAAHAHDTARLWDVREQVLRVSTARVALAALQALACGGMAKAALAGDLGARPGRGAAVLAVRAFAAAARASRAEAARAAVAAAVERVRMLDSAFRRLRAAAALGRAASQLGALTAGLARVSAAASAFHAWRLVARYRRSLRLRANRLLLAARPDAPAHIDSRSLPPTAEPKPRLAALGTVACGPPLAAAARRVAAAARRRWIRTHHASPFLPSAVVSAARSRLDAALSLLLMPRMTAHGVTLPLIVALAQADAAQAAQVASSREALLQQLNTSAAAGAAECDGDAAALAAAPLQLAPLAAVAGAACAPVLWQLRLLRSRPGSALGDVTSQARAVSAAVSLAAGELGSLDPQHVARAVALTCGLVELPGVRRHYYQRRRQPRTLWAALLPPHDERLQLEMPPVFAPRVTPSPAAAPVTLAALLAHAPAADEDDDSDSSESCVPADVARALAGRRARQLQRQALRAWAGWARGRADGRRADVFRRSCVLRRALRALAAHAGAWRSLAVLAGKRAHLQLLRRVFLALRGATTVRVAHLLGAAAAHHGARLSRAALCHWRAGASGQSRLRAVHAAVSLRARASMLSGCLAAWRARTAAAVPLRRFAAGCLQRTRRRLLAAAWTAWRIHRDRSALLRRVLHWRATPRSPGSAAGALR